MKGTCITPIEKLGKGALPKGHFLLLIEPERVPPHLGWIEDGLYFSLSVKGVELEKDARELIRALQRKRKETLLVGIEKCSSGRRPDEAFAAYGGKEPPFATCLGPIGDRLGFSEERIPTVHDLLKRLREHEMLRSPHYLMSEKENGHPEAKWIPPYEEADVWEHLRRYQKHSEGI